MSRLPLFQRVPERDRMLTAKTKLGTAIGLLSALLIALAWLLYAWPRRSPPNSLPVPRSTVDASKFPPLHEAFPHTRFLNSEGRVMDLEKYVGNHNVALVFMRGFRGSICPYCVSQTAELSERIDEIGETGSVAFIVYPGPADKIPLFLEAVRKEMGSGLSDKNAIPILLDVDLEATTALGIREKHAAIPSTFIIDRSGLLHYRYIGSNAGDRLSVTEIVALLQGLDAETGEP